jgi:hypothetical protein
MPSIVRVLLVGGLLSLSGCAAFLYDDRCGPEFRQTLARGDIRDAAGVRIGHAELRLMETRGDSLTRELILILLGPADADPGPLSGKVARLRLLGAGGAVLREFTFDAGNAHEIIRVPPEAVAQAQFDDLKQLAIGGHLQLELETTLEGQGRILVSLPPQYVGDWDRAHCS